MVIFVDIARTHEDEHSIEYRFDSNRGSGWIIHDKQTAHTELIPHRDATVGESASSNGFQ
jgi:hypothetical protein